LFDRYEECFVRKEALVGNAAMHPSQGLQERHKLKALKRQAYLLAASRHDESRAASHRITLSHNAKPELLTNVGQSVQ
jgi:hypothetical protein